jgi:hypothetical protein
MTYEQAIAQQKPLEGEYSVVLFSLSMTLDSRKSEPSVRIFRLVARPAVDELVLPDRLRIHRKEIGVIVANGEHESPYRLAYCFEPDIAETIMQLHTAFAHELIARKDLATDSKKPFWQEKIDLFKLPLRVLYGHSDSPFPL